MAAILPYYKKFVNKLKRNGFQLNPYDPCVPNRLVNNKQKTNCFHVEKCNLCHQDSKVNDKFINALCDKYESVFEDGSGKIKESQGKVHEYLGMTLD